MEGRVHLFVFISLVVAAMLPGSLAQTTHVVGDALGWIVPPGGDVTYRTWAASKTFTVGDVLVFNFTTSIHDVAEVNRAAFDSCNSNNPISLSTTGPTNITLTSAGEHHYICTFASHCGLGQKLAINVSAASAAPAPPSAATPGTAPSPAVTTAPAPSPSRVSPTPPPSTATPGPSTGSPGSAPTPSSSTTPPPSSATPGPSSGSPTTSPPPPPPPSTPTTTVTAPPPDGSSAPSVAVAALPLTFLAVVLAFLYN